MLEIKNLYYKNILENLNFTVNEGSFTILAGKNGSGKSCLLRCIQGLYNYKGSVSYNGISTKKKTVTGLVFQDAQMQIVGQTVAKDLAFGLEMAKIDKKEIKHRVAACIDLFGLTTLKDRMPSTLSGGEKRKVAIADVMILNPKILLLDEPFANLDYSGVKQILKLIVSLHKAGSTILLVTHEVEKVLALADSLIILDNGKIITSGKVEELYSTIDWKKAELRVKGPLKEQSWLND